MPESQEFLQLLEKMKEVHKKKNDDYTSGGCFENFERVAELQSWFKNDIDKAFVGFIAVKLARLGSLLGRKDPQNESIIDSLEDLSIYCGLWTAYHMHARIVSKDAYDEAYYRMQMNLGAYNPNVGSVTSKKST